MKQLIVSVSVAVALCTAASLLVAQDAALARARVLLAKAPLIDGHNDLPWTLRESFAGDLSRADLRQRGATVDTDIPRLRDGQVSAQFWSVFIPSGLSNPARTQLEQIELARRMIDAYPETFLLAARAATSTAPVSRARSPRSSAWRMVRRSRTVSARYARTLRSASGT
jgi:membrane dipeptidase